MCIFASDRTDNLGHVSGKDLVIPDHEKVGFCMEDIQNMAFAENLYSVVVKFCIIWKKEIKSKSQSVTSCQ